MLVALTSSTLSFSTSIQRHLFGRLQCAIGPCLGTCSEVYQFRKERCLISSWLTIHWHIWIHPWDIRSYNFKDLTQHGMMFDDIPEKAPRNSRCSSRTPGWSNAPDLHPWHTGMQFKCHCCLVWPCWIFPSKQAKRGVLWLGSWFPWYSRYWS